MKSNIYRLAALMLAVLMLAACGSSKKAVSSGPKILNLALVEEAYPNRYVDLDYGIRLNVREGPGTSYPALGSAKPGERFPYLGESEGWRKIIFGGEEAYVSPEFSEVISVPAS